MKAFLTACFCGVALTLLGQTYEERAVAAVLMGEAWSEGIEGMTAVAEVIHRRTVEKRKTPLQVITAHRGRIHAFSCLNDKSLDALIEKFKDIPDYGRALEIAKTMCQSPECLPGTTKLANHFTRTNENPWWAKGEKPVVIIGRHAFYRLERY